MRGIDDGNETEQNHEQLEWTLIRSRFGLGTIRKQVWSFIATLNRSVLCTYFKLLHFVKNAITCQRFNLKN